jgi:hypothetical protein
MPAPKSLKPLKIHALIGQQAAWTDELWDEALTYLLERLGTADAVDMALALAAITNVHVPQSYHKIDYLRIFRDYPPSILLGMFDLTRRRRENRAVQGNRLRTSDLGLPLF